MLKSMGIWPLPDLQGLLWNDRSITVLQIFLCSYCSGFFLKLDRKTNSNCFNFFISSGSDFACHYKCTEEQIPMHQNHGKATQQRTGHTDVNEIFKFSVYRCLSCSACRTSEGRIETRPLLKEVVPSFLSCFLQTLCLHHLSVLSTPP